MKALIQAGGQGTRMRPITNEIPKPLLPVKKKPVINRLIELFAKHGVTGIGVLVNEAHEVDFRRWMKAWKGEMPEVELFVERGFRGTFGGVAPLKEWLGSRFFFANADNLMEFDLRALEAAHAGNNAVATLALASVPNSDQYGSPVLDGERITEFREKAPNPSHPWISAGLYLCDAAIFDYADLTKEKVMIEYDIFPRLAAEGKLFAYTEAASRWHDCGTMESWERAMGEW